MQRPVFAVLQAMAVFSLVAVCSSCSRSGEGTPSTKEVAAMDIDLTSSAFKEGAPIPSVYTCDGEDGSPPLKWTNAPEETESYVLICDDPDAPVGTWVHWVIYNIPADTTELPADVPTTEELPIGARQGTNDFKRIGYGGPCPPRGSKHRYFFKLYALNTRLDLRAGVKKDDLLGSMKGHILAEGRLMGTYQRK